MCKIQHSWTNSFSLFLSNRNMSSKVTDEPHLQVFNSENPWKPCFRSESVFVTGNACTLSLVLLQCTETAVCTQSVCIVCECVCQTESVCQSDRQRKWETESESWRVVHVWIVHLHLCVSESVRLCESACTCVRLVQVLGPVCVPGQGMQGSLDSPLLPANETTTHLHTPTLTPHRSGRGWGSLCAPLADR